MKKYTVTIREVLERKVEIYADSAREAEIVAEDEYDNELHVLGSEDHVRTDFICEWS